MKLKTDSIKKIAVFRALQLGDMLCCIPGIRALRHACPEAEITLLGLPWARMLVQRFPQYFDRFIHFPGFPGLPEQPVDPASVTSFLYAIQQEQFDLVLQMQGNGNIVNPFVELLGAAYTAGFCRKDNYCPDPELFLEYPNGISEIEKHIRLMEHLGFPSTGTHLEFPLTKKDEEELRLADISVTPGEYVCVHPGSRGESRRWDPANFAALADLCYSRGLKVVLTGTHDEMEIVENVLGYMKHPAINTAGITTLGAVGCLIRNAALLISNCTGVSHIASALKTPSIVISMDGEPERWAPLNKSLHHTFDWTKEQDLEKVTARLLSCIPAVV